MKKKHRIFLFIISIILLILIIFIIIIYPVVRNNNYKDNLYELISKNTDIAEISSVNKDNNYYIIKTASEVIVLDLNYEEIYRLSLGELKESNLSLTYRRNNLYYQEKIREKKKLTYKFYDVKTLELVYESLVGGA